MKTAIGIFCFLSVLSSRVSAQQQWEYMGGPDGQVITSISQGPSGILYASGFNTFFRCSKGSSKWDSLHSWKARGGQEQALFCSLVLANESVLLGTDHAMLRSTNAGITWDTVGWQSWDTVKYAFQCLSVCLDSTGRALTSFFNSGYLSDDSGQSFHEIDLSDQFSMGWGYATYVTQDGTILRGGTNNGAMITATKSNTTQVLSASKVGSIYSIGSDQTGDWLAGVSDSGIYVRRPRENFHKALNGPASKTIFGIEGTGGDSIFAATVDSGVYLSVDRGETWRTWNDGLELLVTTHLMLGRDGHLYVGTAGYGTYRSKKAFTFLHPLPQAVRSISESKQVLNFDPVTKELAFEGIENKDVSLEVFDLLGRAVLRTCAGAREDKIALNFLPHGNYIVVLSSNGSRYVLKIAL